MTEQEQRTLQREAYQKGFIEGTEYMCKPHTTFDIEGSAQRDAEREYPDPPKPREIILDGILYRVINGTLEARRNCHASWCKSAWSESEIHAIHDLFLNPNE